MENRIKCPNCGHVFDVEQALSEQLEAQLKDEYERKISEYSQKLNREKENLEKEKLRIREDREKLDEIVRERLKESLNKEAEKIEKSLQEKYDDQIKLLKEENEQRSAENKALKQKEILLLKREDELREKEEEMQIQIEKQLLERQKEMEQAIEKRMSEKFEIERRELQKQIEDNKKLAEEMKRKAEQGSMQLQGEAQELALEEFLTHAYPNDEIKEIPKGVEGPDCLQIVKDLMQKECGTIVYESKRTKRFSKKWIKKLKDDQINCKADIAVLVTTAFPSDMDRFGNKEGIWICSFSEVKSLSFVLREMLIKIHAVKLAQVNIGDKKELLYNYLTSNEFVQRIKRIVETYDDMIDQLNSEKKAMNRIWATREKQIWTMQTNIAGLFGSIKGLAGKELETYNVLSLPEKETEIEVNK